VLLLALATAAPASAKSFTLPDARIQVQVAPDGAVVVRETITFAYSGSFSGAYRDIPLRKGESVDRISVAERGDRYRSGGSITLGTDGPPSQFGAGVVDGKQRIVWRFRAADQRRTYTIRYRISGLAVAHDDVVDVNLQVWGSTWDTGLTRLAATMAAPQRVSARNARVFGHPVTVRGDTAFEGGLARLRALDVPERQFVEMRLLFPRSMLTSTRHAKVEDGEARGRIVAAERADAADYEENRQKIDDALDSIPKWLLVLLLAGLAPAAAIVGLVWLLLSRERRVADYDREYEQEPPSDDPPALVAPLLRQSTKPEGPEFTATLFDLIRRGYITTEPTTTSKWSWGALGKREGSDLMLSRKGATGSATPLEKGVTKVLERALGNGPIPLSELSDKIKENREANAASYSSWQEKIEKEFARRHWYDGRAAAVIKVAALAMVLAAVALIAIGVVGLDADYVRWGEVLQIGLGVAALINAIALLAALRNERLRRRWTPAAALEAARWSAFRRYLRDFPRLQEAPPESVAVWERLLVYGIAFGLADRVLQAAKIAAPEALAQESGIYAPGYYSGGESFYSSSSMSGVSGGFSSALSPPSSGSDGGGGGFSGGGGDGGGGGGGGAW
jgi:uncharacterized membrane protein